VISPRLVRGRFIVRTQGGSVLHLSWFVRKLWGFQNWVTWPRPGTICPLYLCQIWSRELYSSKIIKGVPKLQNWVMWPRPRPFRGRLCSTRPSQWGYVLHIFTKFEAVSQHLEIGSRDPGHAQLWVILGFLCRNCPSSIICAKLDADSSILSKVIRVPTFRNWVMWPKATTFLNLKCWISVNIYTCLLQNFMPLTWSVAE